MRLYGKSTEKSFPVNPIGMSAIFARLLIFLFLVKFKHIITFSLFDSHFNFHQLPIPTSLGRIKRKSLERDLDALFLELEAEKSELA